MTGDQFLGKARRALPGDRRADMGVERNQRPVGFKQDFLRQVRVIDRNLCRQRNRPDQTIIRLVEFLGLEFELGPGRMGRFRRDTQKVEEFDVVEFRDTVEFVEDGFRHPGMKLDQRHARVAVVEIGPFGRVARNALAGFAHQIIEAAGVEFGGGQWHRAILTSGLR